MLKVYKILLITYFAVTTSDASLFASVVYAPPELTLLVKSGKMVVSPPSEASQKPLAEYSHTAYKITQTTRKINTALVHKEADLLIHFTEDNNQVIVQVSDVQGRVVSSVHHPAMDAGFYEIPVLPSSNTSSLYFISLIINQQTYSFQVSSQP